MSPSGRLFFIRHRAGLPEQGFRTAELFSVPPGERNTIPGLVGSLGSVPPGATRRWDDLLDPVWLEDGSLLVIGAHWIRVPDCRDRDGCPYDRPRYNGADTITLGVEIARVSGLESGQMQISSLLAAPDILSMALDRSNMQLVLLRQFQAPADESFYESLADTIYRMPLGGSTPVPVAGTPRLGGPFLERYHSVAVAGGRTFISRSWYSGSSPNPGDLRSDIAELRPDGSTVSLWTAPRFRWGRITAAPDGSALLAEMDLGFSHDIYLIPLQ